MYFEIVGRVIEKAVELHAASSQKSSDEVFAEINAHIEDTSREHRKDDPQIQYEEPLCRLGYLFMHATANATLFERVIQKSDDLRLKISNASQGVLNISSMGGGPGTELLGLAKYLLNGPGLIPPRRISFTVVDNVSAWADTWKQLAEATEDKLRSSLSQNGMELPTVAPMFLPFDAFDSSSYRLHLGQFNELDVVVFNYLFSENKTRLGQAREAISELVRVTGHKCVFVVIDRLEQNTSFTNDVVGIFESALGVKINYSTFGGKIDADEQTSELGPMLKAAIKRNPRLTFYNFGSGTSTVFWFVVERK